MSSILAPLIVIIIVSLILWVIVLIPLWRSFKFRCHKTYKGLVYLSRYRIIHLSTVERLQKELDKARQLIEFQQNTRVINEKGQLKLDFELPYKNGARITQEAYVWKDSNGNVAPTQLNRNYKCAGWGIWSTKQDHVSKLNSGKIYIKRGKNYIWINSEHELQKGDQEMYIPWSLDKVLVDYTKEENVQ